MISEHSRHVTYIKLGDIASRLVGKADLCIPGERFDTIEEVYDTFCEGEFAWGTNDLTFVKLGRFVEEYPFVALVIDVEDLSADYVLLEE